MIAAFAISQLFAWFFASFLTTQNITVWPTGEVPKQMHHDFRVSSVLVSAG